MDMFDEDECEQLKEEYEALRRRLESAEFAEITQPNADDESLDFSDLHIDKDDVQRFREIEEQLMEECGEELPGDADEEVDIPQYVLDDLAQK